MLGDLVVEYCEVGWQLETADDYAVAHLHSIPRVNQLPKDRLLVFTALRQYFAHFNGCQQCRYASRRVS